MHQIQTDVERSEPSGRTIVLAELAVVGKSSTEARGVNTANLILKTLHRDSYGSN